MQSARRPGRLLGRLGLEFLVTFHAELAATMATAWVR